MSVNNSNKPYNPNIKEIDLSDGFIEIYDQGQLGSCAVNAFCALFNYELVRALGMAQPKTSITLNNFLSMFMLSCIRNGTSTKYECTVVDELKRNKYNYIEPFRPSRYYLYYYACTRNNNNNIDPDDFKDGGGSHIGLIIEKVTTFGILKELPDENNNRWQLEKSFDHPITNDEKIVKINELKNKIVLKENEKAKLIISDKDYKKKIDDINADIGKMKKLIENYENLNIDSNINLTNSEEIIKAYKWKQINKKVIDSESIAINNNIIRKYLQNSKPILISMRFNQIGLFDQLTTIYPSDITQNAGHMMVIVGYDDLYDNKKGAYKVRNSWGAGWGKKGYCYLSYDFFEGDASKIKSLDIININLDNYSA
jgi:hypothetical protein